MIGISLSLQRGSGVSGGTPTPTPSMFVQPARTDSSWQGQVDSRMIAKDGYTYAVTITGKYSKSVIEVHRWSPTGELETFQVQGRHSDIVTDDHDVNGATILPDGRMIVYLVGHQSTAGISYRVSRQPVPNLEAGWSDKVTIPLVSGATSTGYVHPFLRSDGMLYLLSRVSHSTAPGWYWYKAPAADIVAGTATWTNERCTAGSGAYNVGSQVGDTIYFASTTSNPEGPSCDLVGWKVDMSAGGDVYRRLDGSVISAPVNVDSNTMSIGTQYAVLDGAPLTSDVNFVPAGCTPLFTWRTNAGKGTTQRNCRIYDSWADSSGNVRFVFATSEQWVDAPENPQGTKTDIHIFFGRYIPGTGVRLTTVREDDWSMPDTINRSQCGEGSFDGRDPNKFWIAMRDNSTNIHEIYTLNITPGTTLDTVTTTQITTGSGIHQAKPFSPANWENNCRAFWYERKEMLNFGDFYCRTRFFGIMLNWTAPTYETEVTTWATATGTTTKLSLMAMNIIVKALKAGPQSATNMWASMGLVTVPAFADSSAGSLRDLKTGTSWTVEGAPTWAAGNGWIGLATTTDDVIAPLNLNALPGYANTKFSQGGFMGRLRSGTTPTMVGATSANNDIRTTQVRNHAASMAINTPWLDPAGMGRAVARNGNTAEIYSGPTQVLQNLAATPTAAQTVPPRLCYGGSGTAYAGLYWAAGESFTKQQMEDIAIATHKAMRMIAFDNDGDRAWQLAGVT